MESAALAEHRNRLERDGYTIIDGVLSVDACGELLDRLQVLEHELAVVPATNSFEGQQTWRIYNLLAHGVCFASIPVNPEVLPVVETVLDHECLISSLSSIAIGPGEAAQPIHADDQVMPLTKPHVATVCNTMWALTDFTEANGATRIIPGTHTVDHSPVYLQHYDSIAAEMTAGSVLVWHGSLWHGGGANSTDARRVGIALNYCAGWVRQQENQQLGIPLDVIRSFSPRLQELCGFGTYRRLIGHIERSTPARRLLDDERARPMVWEA